ncbi:MAG: hypothetical protein ABEJ82_02175 [Haloplanus sp.]
MAELRAALREQKFPRHLVLGALLFVGFAVATGHSLWTFAPAFGIAVAWELFDVVADVYAFPDGSKPAVIGVVLAGISTWWLVARRESLWLPAVALAFGLWLAADGYKTYRDGPVKRSTGPYFEDIDGQTGEAMYRMQLVGKVARAVREQPRPAEELAADLGLTEAHVEEILETLEVRGTVSRSDGVYRANESRFGKTTAVVRFLRWLSRRLLRPLT